MRFTYQTNNGLIRLGVNLVNLNKFYARFRLGAHYSEVRIRPVFALVPLERYSVI